MKSTQLTQGKERRLMYVENKNGFIDGFSAHIGWVTFSKTGNTVYYRHLVLNKVRGGGVQGNWRQLEKVHAHSWFGPMGYIQTSRKEFDTGIESRPHDRGYTQHWG